MRSGEIKTVLDKLNELENFTVYSEVFETACCSVKFFEWLDEILLYAKEFSYGDFTLGCDDECFVFSNGNNRLSLFYFERIVVL